MANQKPRVLRKKLKMSIKVEGKRNSQVETSISFTLYIIVYNLLSYTRLNIMLSSKILLLTYLVEKKIMEYIFNISDNRKKSQIFIS